MSDGGAAERDTADVVEELKSGTSKILNEVQKTLAELELNVTELEKIVEGLKDKKDNLMKQLKEAEEFGEKLRRKCKTIKEECKILATNADWSEVYTSTEDSILKQKKKEKLKSLLEALDECKKLKKKFVTHVNTCVQTAAALDEELQQGVKKSNSIHPEFIIPLVGSILLVLTSIGLLFAYVFNFSLSSLPAFSGTSFVASIGSLIAAVTQYVKYKRLANEFTSFMTLLQKPMRRVVDLKAALTKVNLDGMAKKLRTELEKVTSTEAAAPVASRPPTALSHMTPASDGDMPRID